MIRKLKLAFQSSLFIALSLGMNVGVFAQGNDDWQITITPNIWFAGIKGEVATLGDVPPIEIDVAFDDILSSIDMILAGFAEARKGRFALFSEVFYISMSVEGEAPGPLYLGVDYKQDLLNISLGGSYTLTEDPRYVVDVLAGIRYTDLDNEFKFQAGTAPAQTVSDQDSWNDFFVGLKGRRVINDRWAINGWAMSAVAGDSDSYWDIYVGVVYTFNDTIAMDMGYRHQETDYKNGSFLFDVEMSGPIISLGFTL